MAVTLFKPAIWSGKILSNLNNAHVFKQVVNHDYDGDITKYGDQVKINNIGRITVNTYTPNTDIDDPETLTAEQRILLIDQANYFNFQIDDVDDAQTNPKLMGEATEESAYALADTCDQYIAGLETEAGVVLEDTGNVPYDVNSGNAYDLLVDIAVSMDEANVPKIKRFVVIPPWYKGALMKDDRYVKDNPGADKFKTKNQIGEVAGMKVMESNNIVNTAGADYRIMAGYMGTISMAEQIVDTEAYRMEKRFSDALKGLHVYGAKVVRPETLIVLSATPVAEA